MASPRFATWVFPMLNTKSGCVGPKTVCNIYVYYETLIVLEVHIESNNRILCLISRRRYTSKFNEILYQCYK